MAHAHLAVSLMLLVAPFLAGEKGPIGAGLYGWSLSGSNADPYLLSEPPFVGERQLYLWFCELAFGGIIAAEMDLSGSLEIIGVTGQGGVTATWTPPTLQLSFPECTNPDNYLIAAVATVRDATGTGGRICFSGANNVWDCASNPQPHDWLGYGTDGAPICGTGSCGIDVASPESWGRVKAQYAR